MRRESGTVEVVGCSPAPLPGVCIECDGDGELATTTRAAEDPKGYPDELVVCPDCKGVGGDTLEAGAQGRAFSAAYLEALTE